MQRHAMQRQSSAYNRDIKPTLVPVFGTKIFSACAANDVAQVVTLTSRATITDWPTVLITAVFENATDVANYCLSHYGRSIVDDVLQWVLNTEHADPVYHYLIESNLVDVNHPIDRWGTVLGVAASMRRIDRSGLVEFALKKGANPNRTVEIKGNLRILTCAAGYSDQKILRLLLNYGAEVRDSGALVFAAQKGRVENVQLLIAHGARLDDMGIVDGDERSLAGLGTPLHKAVENGHIQVVDILLQAGADRMREDARGRTAEEVAVEKGMETSIVARLKPVY